MPYIYSLVDPTNDRVRYIGKTSKPLCKRLAQHVYRAKNGNKSHRDSWIRSLLKHNLRPIIHLVEEVSDVSWEEREIYWIAEYKKCSELTNIAEGGGTNRPKSGQDNHKATYSREQVREVVTMYVLGCSTSQIKSLPEFESLSEKTIRSWAQKEARVCDTLGIPTKSQYRRQRHAL